MAGPRPSSWACSRRRPSGSCALRLHRAAAGEPLIELSLFRSATSASPTSAASILAFGMMGVFFLLPIFLQSILGYSVIKAGLVLTPLAAVVIFAAPTSGWLSDRIGSRWLMFGGHAGHRGRASTSPGGSWSLDAGWQVFVAALHGLGVRHRHGDAAHDVGRDGLGAARKGRDRPPECSRPCASWARCWASRSWAPCCRTGRSSISSRRCRPSWRGALHPGRGQGEDRGGRRLDHEEHGRDAGRGGMAEAARGSRPTCWRRVPAAMVEQMKSFFTDLFSREVILGEFVRAMQTTFLVSLVVLLMRLWARRGPYASHVSRAPVAASVDEGESRLAVAEAGDPLVDGGLARRRSLAGCRRVTLHRQGAMGGATRCPRRRSSAGRPGPCAILGTSCRPALRAATVGAASSHYLKVPMGVELFVEYLADVRPIMTAGYASTSRWCLRGSVLHQLSVRHPRRVHRPRRQAHASGDGHAGLRGGGRRPPAGAGRAAAPSSSSTRPRSSTTTSWMAAAASRRAVRSHRPRRSPWPSTPATIALGLVCTIVVRDQGWTTPPRSRCSTSSAR